MYRTFAAVSALVLALDLTSKYVVVQTMAPGAQIVIWPGVFSLTYVRNAGAAFGLLQGQRLLFLGAAALITVALACFRKDLMGMGMCSVLASGLVFGGTLGNLVDRLRLDGRVVDFIHFHFFGPVFNLADSALVVGAILMGWTLLRADL